LTRKELSGLIDHTQVRAYATQLDVAELCKEAAEHGFKAVTVNPAWTSYCVKQLKGTDVRVSATIGCPLGAHTARTKIEETRDAIKNGAAECDLVINIGALKPGFPDFVEQEIQAVVKAAGAGLVKVILEVCYLTDEEKIAACEMSERAGAGFVKTSTGFGGSGATTEDVRLMREVVGDRLGIKAAGGIRSYADLSAMIEAGATRIGTSAGLKILAEASGSLTS
jgi:deoxyribose-phosphate aldolase